MDKPRNQLNLSRRGFLGTAAVGTTAAVGLAATGCSEKKKTITKQKSQLPHVKPFKDLGYRMFVVEPTGEHFEPQFLAAAYPRISILQHGSAFQPGSETKFVLWTLPEKAKELAQSEEVKAVVPKGPQHIFQSGNVEQPAGQLGIKLFPFQRVFPPDTPNYASIEQVAKAWIQWAAKKELKGLEFEPILTSEPPTSGVGDMVEPLQILLKFEGELPESLLEEIKNHPQTIELNWGGPFTQMYCPPCGMG